jgi:hypothetical protein
MFDAKSLTMDAQRKGHFAARTLAIVVNGALHD